MPIGEGEDGPVDDASIKWRLAVHERGHTEPICLVWQSATDLQVQRKGASEIAAVVKALGPVVAEGVHDRLRWEDDGGVIGAPWSAREACYAALESAGFDVRPIPIGDVEMRITVDASGRIVGESIALQGTLNEGLAGDLFKRLRAMPENLATELRILVAEAIGRDDHEAAAAAALEKGPTAVFLGVTPTLLAALRMIDVGRLSPELRRETLLLRVGVAGGLKSYGNDAVRDVQLLKEQFWSELGEGAREGLLLLEGCGAMAAGHPDTAFAIWRSVLQLADLSASGRAWACNNLATLLKTTDPAAAKYVQLASDAFLQDGQRVEAARNSLRLANCILAEKPADALRHIDEAIEWFAPDDANSRDLRAGLLHAKASALLRLGHAADAEEVARQAAELRRGIHGAEEGRCSSLYLAAFAAKDAGRPEAWATYKLEADALAAKSDDAVGNLLRQIGSLFQMFDASAADRLDTEAVTQGNQMRARTCFDGGRLT
jgi:hypothetical protein